MHCPACGSHDVFKDKKRLYYACADCDWYEYYAYPDGGLEFNDELEEVE